MRHHVHLFALLLLVCALGVPVSQTQAQTPVVEDLFSQQFADPVRVQRLLNQFNSPLAQYRTPYFDSEIDGAMLLLTAGASEDVTINPQLTIAFTEWQWHLIDQRSPTNFDASLLQPAPSGEVPPLLERLKQFAVAVVERGRDAEVEGKTLEEVLDQALVDIGITADALELIDVYHRLFNSPSGQTRAVTRSDWRPAFRKPFDGFSRINSFFDHSRYGDGLVTRADGRTLSENAGSGKGWYDGHAGIDYNLASVPIRAAGSGAITMAGYEAPWYCAPLGRTVAGIGVKIRHSNGFDSLYWHLASVSINPRTGVPWRAGENINEGEVVGISGNTGCSTGAHLHFGIKEISSGQAVDPYGFLGNPRQQPLFRSTTTVNEGADGFERFHHAYWYEAPGEGGHAFYTNTGTSTDYDNWALWWADIPQSGEYEIFAYVPGAAEAIGARYRVSHRDGVSDVVRNQSDNRERWMSLGTYWFDAHSLATVHLLDYTTGPGMKKLFFDAIRWERRQQNQAPNAPSLLAPTDNSTVIGSQVSLTWQDQGDPDNGPRNYRDFSVEVKNNAGEVVATMPWAAATTWNVDLPVGNYVWHVKSGDGNLESTWSADWHFTVAAVPTPAPTQAPTQVPTQVPTVTPINTPVPFSGYTIHLPLLLK